MLRIENYWRNKTQNIHSKHIRTITISQFNAYSNITSIVMIICNCSDLIPISFKENSNISMISKLSCLQFSHFTMVKIFRYIFLRRVDVDKQNGHIEHINYVLLSLLLLIIVSSSSSLVLAVQQQQGQFKMTTFTNDPCWHIQVYLIFY